MKLIYQWTDGSYGNIACIEAKKILKSSITEIVWLSDFWNVWKNIDENSIWVVPVENSYAWNIHENLYNFLRYDYKVIWQINLEVNHCLLSTEKNISKIKQVYSHPQALSQCYNFLKKYNIKPIVFWDTAWACEMVKNEKLKNTWAIGSTLAWEIYWLNKIKESIQDQKWNTTRFFIVVPKNVNIELKKKANKISIIFEAKNIPASLYKCLWAFATNNVNLTKIESLPSLKNPFTYLFWMDFEWSLQDENIKKSIDELKFFTKNIKVLGEY